MKPEGSLLNLPKIPTPEKEQDDWIKDEIFQFACQQLWGTGDNEEETNGIFLGARAKKKQCMVHHRANTV